MNYKLLIAYKDKGLRAYQLAEKAGIEETRFCRIVNEKLKPKKEEKQILSKLLKMNQKDLF